METSTTTITPTATDPLLNSTTLISTETQSLHTLALDGSWLKILEKTTALLNLSLSPNHSIHPHDHLTHLTFHILSLTKLRRYADAVSKLDTSPDLDSPSCRYESYPHLYPSRSGSMVPFSLHTLRAILPSFISRPSVSLDRLYSLLAFVRSNINHDGGDRNNSSDQVWRRREEFTVSLIIGQHSGQKEYLICVALLKDIISKDPNNVNWLSKLGYIYLQFGDIEAAKAAFKRVEEIVLGGGGGDGVNLIGRNKALVYLVGKDYASAVREYDECIERDGSDVVAINNKALCLMYLRDLGDSIKVIEGSLERVPNVALNETLVVNLCSMYELAYVNHGDIKKTLSNWIARLAPDDFDSSCTRV